MSDPLERWIAALPADTRQVLVVPRLGALTEPLLAALRRLRRQPLLAKLLGGLPESLPGLRAQGPLLIATTPRGQIELWPVDDPGLARQLLASTAAGRSSQVWRGMLVRAANPAGLAERLNKPRGVSDGPVSLRGCPRRLGAADAFLLARGPGPRGCLTLRIDTDRVRLDAKLEGARGWLRSGDGRLTDLAGGGVLGLLVGRLGPRGLARLREGLDPKAPRIAKRLAARFDGRVAIVAGPGADDWTLAAGMRDPAVAWEEVAFWLRGWRPQPVERFVLTPAEGGWRLQVQPEPGRPTLGPDQLWIGRRGDLLVATTRRDRLLHVRGGLAQDVAAGRTETSPALLAKPAALLHLRLRGEPHDGAAWAQALRPLAGWVSIAPDLVDSASTALAFTLAHVLELTVRADPTDRGLRLAVELVLL